MPGHAFAAGWAFVLAVAEEFRRATAAAHRYEQLKWMARARDDPEPNAARRVYLEFYSHARPDSPHGSGLRAVLHVPRKTARMNSRIAVDLDELADMLSATAEGGIVISKVMRQKTALSQQLMLYRRWG